MCGSQGLNDKFEELVTNNPNQVKSSDRKGIVETLKKRMDSGGTVVLNQDIYLRDPIGAKFADIVLPATTWGEEDFVRVNGERHIRLYSKFYDAPGDSKPDWWIFAELSKRLHDTTVTQEQMVAEGRTQSANMVNKKGTHFNSQTGKVNIQKPLASSRKRSSNPDTLFSGVEMSSAYFPSALFFPAEMPPLSLGVIVGSMPELHVRWKLFVFGAWSHRSIATYSCLTFKQNASKIRTCSDWCSTPHASFMIPVFPYRRVSAEMIKRKFDVRQRVLCPVFAFVTFHFS